MKSLYLALAAALTLSAGSGCCLLDHCLGHHCGCGGGCDNCGGEACSYCGPNCGACGCCGDNCSCPPGGCGPGGCGQSASAGYNKSVPTTARKPGGKRQPQPQMEPHEEAMPVSYQQRVTQASYEGGASAGEGYAGGSCEHANYEPSCPNCQQCGMACGRCGNCTPAPNCRDGHRAVADQLGGPAGPPCGQVTYPYYTTRGPRDFLMNNPPRIGP